MKKEVSKRIILPLSFALPALAMAAVLALCGVTPFGDSTLGVMDMSHQYISFLYSLRDILAGRASVLYLPSMCLGGNMLGVAAYYLASPLDLLTCLFPRENMYQAVSLLYILRVGLCGLTMSVYTGRRNGYGPRCLVSAMAYAFMAYMLAYSFNYLWQDCVILLPVIALGVARLREERRPWLYIISLAGALWMNFYIGYSLCIFSVLFFLYELFSVPKARRSGAGRTVGVFALSSLAAGALSAVVLVPAFLSLSGGKASFSLSELTWTANFSLAELLSKLYPGAFAYEQIMPEGLPQIFCGTVTVTLAILYFANRAVPRRRRIFTGALMGVIVLSFWINALDLVWHGFNRPSWYNYRYSFILCFLLAAAADKELALARDGSRLRHLALPLGLLAAASLYVFTGRSYDYVSWPSAIAAVAVAAAACAGMWLYLRPGTGRRLTAAAAWCLLLVHVAELGANGVISLSALTGTAPGSGAYAEYAAAKGEAFSQLDTGDVLVRVESASSFGMNRCEPMLFGYDGVSHYGSTISQESLDFLDRLGLDRYDGVWAIYGAGVTAAADSLLGVGYVVDETTSKNYEPVAAGGGYTVWKNPNALPAAWTAGGAMVSTLTAEDSFSYLDALYAAAAPEVRETIYTAADVENEALENFTRDGERYLRLEESPATVTYTVAVRAGGPLYAQLDIPDDPGVMVFVNDAYLAWYATTQTNGTLYLGDFAAGDRVTVRLQASSDITVRYAAFATENADALAKYTAAISEGGCPLTKHTAAHYTGSFTTGAGDELLVFTLPYDRGWKLWLDGEPAEPVKVQDCLMAVSVTPGAHTVELCYTPPGLTVGGGISLGALCLCAGTCAVLRVRKKRRKPVS